MERHIPPAPFEWARTMHYSQSVRVGDLVFTSGQSGYGVDGELVDGGIEEQLRQTFANLGEVLSANGASLSSLVKLTVHLADPGDVDVWRSVRSELLSPPWPATTAIGSALLAEGMLCEVDAIAVSRSTGSTGPR